MCDIVSKTSKIIWLSGGKIIPLYIVLKNNDILLLTLMFFSVYSHPNELTNLF